MRFFFCAFRGFYLAIPIRAVSSLMLYPYEAAQDVEYREENGNTYFSLPRLLHLPDETIRHGIVLKTNGAEEAETDDRIENKNILLTTEVEREIDIPETELYPLPRVLAAMGTMRMFSGIQFSAAGSPVLALDPAYVVVRYTAYLDAPLAARVPGAFPRD
jgi:hypothetical protein